LWPPPPQDRARLERAQRHSSHQLTVATLSVAGLRFGVERVADALAALDADLIGLQAMESGSARAQGRDAPAQLAERLGYHVAFAPAAALDQGQRGVALLSRAPLESVKRVVLGQGGDAPGALLLARLTQDGLRWTVGVVEISAPAPAGMADVRRAQARQIAEELGGRANCVLLADLSGPAESTSWVPLTMVGRFVGLDAGPTYPARAPTQRRDHVLISPELWARAVKVVDTGAADHRALVVQVATRR